MALAARPHPMSVYLMLKQAWRSYLSSGAAVSITFDPITTWVHTVMKIITGHAVVVAGVRPPATISVAIKLGAATVTTVTSNVDASTGVWAVTVPANALVANTYTAVATTTAPPGTATSSSFVVT